MSILNASSLILIIIGMSAQNIIKKGFNKRSGGKGVFTFNAMTVLAACIFFLIISGFKLPLAVEALPFILGFAIAYFCAVLFNFLAIKEGSLSLTSLVMSYSLLIPTAYGLIFDGDEAGIWLYAGIALLAVSLVLINSKNGETKITVKWLVFALLSLIGNGVCSTVQTVQTRLFGGVYDNTFMVIALGTVFISLSCFAFFSERDEIVPSLKCGTHLMLLCGVANGVVNLFVMIASAVINKSVMFPVISAGGIVVTWFVSVFLYKEKLSKSQNLGMLLGIISIIFLNI